MNRSFSPLLAGLLCLGPAFYTKFCYEKFKVQGSKFKVRSAPLFMLLERANGS